jgi:low molecular weight protein-tyrosine phosphatase
VPDDTFDVVFVCTGNQFRSPLAEAVFARETDGRSVHVSSCGTSAIEGSAAFAEALDLVSELSVDLSHHLSRRLHDLADADLVIGFQHTHVERAVVDANAPRDRSFTLPQAVELLESSPREGSPAERLAVLMPGSLLEAPEMEDPIGLATERQREIMTEVEQLTSRLARALFD